MQGSPVCPPGPVEKVPDDQIYASGSETHSLLDKQDFNGPRLQVQLPAEATASVGELEPDAEAEIVSVHEPQAAATSPPGFDPVYHQRKLDGSYSPHSPYRMQSDLDTAGARAMQGAVHGGLIHQFSRGDTRPLFDLD